MTQFLKGMTYRLDLDQNVRMIAIRARMRAIIEDRELHEIQYQAECLASGQKEVSGKRPRFDLSKADSMI
jgi:hypothetical protein